jgi:hypothetical protein
VPAPLGDVNLAANDGFDASGGRFVVEIGCGKKIAVVRHGDRGHAPARCLVQQFGDVASSIEQTEVRVKMQMNELRLAHVDSILSPVARFIERAHPCESHCASP